MEEDLIIKKIYINDYIINTTLLKNSISNLLINTLSNKFYKTNKIERKINNILNKVENIFTETSSGNKIFNLAYQPYNQYNITYNYDNNDFNKKWIIPIVNENKTLSQNVVKVKNFDYYYTDELLIEKINDETYIYDSKNIDIKTKDNYFQDENEINYSIEHVNILGNISFVEMPVLSDNMHIYNINDPNNISISKSYNKVIRTKTSLNSKLSVINSDNTLSKSDPPGVKEINKEIIEILYEVRNILPNENINIKQYLILNPLKLINTNYNITLGNTISYLNEIMNTTHVNIDTIIKNYDEDLSELNLEVNDNKLEHYIVDKEEMSNQYNNEDNFIYDYLKIIKNLDKFEDKIYSIRILKHIYNIFGYDLNKVPNCYIVYLKDILHRNITKYINNNSTLLNYLINTFKFHKSIQNKTITEDIKLIMELYNIDNIDNIIYSENESLYSILQNNTYDNGFLYYLNLYNNTYLKNNNTKNAYKLINNDLENKSTNCNYRIVKTYKSEKEYADDTLRFVDLNYSLDNYLIEYDDLIHNLQKNNVNEYNYKNSIYQQNKKNINHKNNDKSYIKLIEDKTTINNFILENKLYILNLLLNSYDINIVFTKFILLHYKNKKYFQIPYLKIQEENIILINNKPFQYINDSLTEITKSLDELDEEIKFKCNQNNIEKNNIDNLNKFYDDLNKFDISTHNQNISNLIDIFKNDNEFKKFLLSKSTSYLSSQIYFKNIEKIIYPITSNDSSIIVDYLTNYNYNSIKTSKLTEEQLLNKISNSRFNSEYIKQIRIISEDINNSSGKNMWNYIHHYVNEYELLTNVIIDGDKYNRAYYKMWEILLDNKIIDKPDFKYIALAEAPGNFVNCVRNLKSSNWNNFIIFTLLDDNNTVKQGNFLNKYKNFIFGNPDGSLKLTNIEDKNFNGNLTKSIDINIFIKYIETNNSYADLITADGGMKKDSDIDYLLEEYNHLPLFLGEVITALFTQKIGGTFILKMYDIVYINSVNLINLLSCFYNNVYITKPYSSRPCNTEKYIVCSDFKGISNNKSNKNTILKNLLVILDNLDITPDNYKHFDIFENLIINDKNTSEITEFNNSIIVKTQLLHLQDIYDIIKKNDQKQLNLIKTYFGPKRNLNIKNILSSEENEDKGYFIKKIESCIILALYLNIKNQPLKTEYIDYYGLIKNMKSSVLNTNIYPPHFKEIYEIRKEENKSIQFDKINKFIKKYCIVFEKPGQHKIIDYYILRTVEHFLLNKDIANLDHYVINKFRDNKTNLNNLHKYLEALCKSTDIKKLFYLQNSNVISLIKNFQNNIRTYLGYYLCKYTYIPIYPKYKALDNVIDQVEQYGILYNSQYICYYSGDKFDMEEFDDFMGDTIFRSNISLFDEVSSTGNTITEITSSYNNDLNIEQNICSFILNINQFKLDKETKLDIINKLDYINNSTILDDIINDVQNNYIEFESKLNKIYDKSLFKKIVLKLNSDDFTESNIVINSKINNIISILNSNNEEITKDKPLNKNHLFIKTILDLVISLHFNKSYINIIIYTLTQIKNKTNNSINNIYNIYSNNESNLIISTYLNSPELFNIFKSKLLQDYLLKIKLPQFSYGDSIEKNTIDEIFTMNENNETIISVIETHIKTKSKNWHPNRHWTTKDKKDSMIKKLIENFDKLNESKTVLDFLHNIPYRDNKRAYIAMNVLIKDNIINSKSLKNLSLNYKNYLKNYLSLEQFTECYQIFNDEITNNFTFNSKNNIENNINDNREDLVNKSLLNYKNNLAVFAPNYDITPPDVYDSNEKNIYNSIKYLYLHVFESEQHKGKKRIFDNDVCLYTDNTKTSIINSIHELSNTELINIYLETFNHINNRKIVNNPSFVNKNILDKSYISLIYNTVYKIDNKYIDIFYTLIKLFYLSKEPKNTTVESNSTIAQQNITTEESDIFKNIIMRYYNDPITNIISFLDKYKDEFIEFTKSTDLATTYDFASIINNLYESRDNDLFNIISNVNDNNLNTINSNLISKIKDFNNILNKYDIVIDLSLNIKDIILLVNNIKKSLSYISNISNLNIINDLKNNKYKNIKKLYSQYEYDKLIDIIGEYNYNYNLLSFKSEDFDYIEIVFTELLTMFNYNFNNIFSPNIDTTKFIMLYKLYKILINCINKLTKPYTFNIDSNLINKYHIFENKIQQTKLESILLNSSTFSIDSNDKKYFNLFTSIITTSINNINKYSLVIKKLNPDKYINDDESITFDNTDFNDITSSFTEALMGDEEEMD